MTRQQTLNLNGRLFDISTPQVMGIVNVTPDSFYAGSRISSEKALRERVRQIIDEGGTMVDLGACSTRPGSNPLSEEEEMERLEAPLRLLHDEFPEIPVSVDTYRSSIARRAVQEFGVALINDISGGTADSAMFDTIAQLQVPYILMHLRGGIEQMHQTAPYEPNVETAVMDFFIERVGQLRALGAKDIILDPGYGFSKTMEDNYRLFARSAKSFDALQCPILVGISRKRMVWQLLNSSPEEALNGTSALHTSILLDGGADILRVHDVRAAVEVIGITKQIRQYKK